MSGALDLAARLGRSTEDYGAELIVSGHALAELAPAPSRRLDVVQLEPEGEPIELYEVLFTQSDVDAVALEAYARGMAHYEAGQFAKAIKEFDEVLQRTPLDRAATRLLARCRTLLGTPSAGWRGVWPFEGAGG
jgi:hypothetical protein